MSKIVNTIDGHFGELLYIKGNTAYIKENNGEVWYCPKTDIIDEVSERDLFLDTIKEIVETNNWDGNKDKKIEHLQSQLDHQKVMWHKLKEFILKKQEEHQAGIIEQEMQGSIPNSISFYARYNICNEIQKKMQELEAEDVED